MAIEVTGDLYVELDGKLAEIKRQMRQPGGYPFDPEKLNRFLQRAVEGRFDDSQCWHEEDGVIYFSVTSDGTTGVQWVEWAEKNGVDLGSYAKSLFFSPDFKPTCGVTTKIAVLKGMLFADRDRITSKIRAEADKRKLDKPNAEVAGLIRRMFSDEEIKAMGLWWIVVMHEPIKDSDGDPVLLGAGRDGIGRRLSASYGEPDGQWRVDRGFAFAVSQVSSV